MTNESYPSADSKSAYVPEIDGLRAIAVISVILFHLGFNTVSGGYVGVDIFFVISGYLITKIIALDIERQRFSYFSFMMRRIARLYPALAVTLIISVLAGFLLMAPAHYKTLSHSTITAFLSISNFEFWRGTGYFDTSSETNPLLHTWSLGVEQQFYFVWPLLLLLIYNTRRSAIGTILFLTLITSLILSQWATTSHSSAAYFLMPFRIFEFTVGGLTFWLERYWIRTNILLEVLLILGLCLLLYGFLVFTPSTAFPGVNALIPTIGASLCILGGKAKFVGFILRNKLMTFLGLISYSLYLAHWPIIVFYKYYIYRPIRVSDKIGILICSVLFAYLIYRFVETKYRKINITNLSLAGVAKLAGTACLVVMPALIVYFQNGVAYREFPERSLTPKQFQEEEYGGTGFSQGSYDLGDPNATEPSALIMGDSYARQHSASLDNLLKVSHKKFRTSFTDACIFSKKYTSIMYGKPRIECLIQLNYALDYLSTHPGLPLIYTINWGGYETLITTLDGKQENFANYETYVTLMIDNVSEIASAIGDHKLIIITSPPGIRNTTGLSGCVERPRYLGSRCENELLIDQNVGNAYYLIEKMKEQLKSKENVIFLNSGDAFCSAGKCSTLDNGRFIYSDAHHLSKYGSALFVQHFKNFFQGL